MQSRGCGAENKITVDDIVAQAFELFWDRNGPLIHKGRGPKIGCSTMPIYSHFKNLEALEHGVMEKCRDLLMQYEARNYTGDTWIEKISEGNRSFLRGPDQ